MPNMLIGGVWVIILLKEKMPTNLKSVKLDVFLDEIYFSAYPVTSPCVSGISPHQPLCCWHIASPDLVLLAYRVTSPCAAGISRHQFLCCWHIASLALVLLAYRVTSPCAAGISRQYSNVNECRLGIFVHIQAKLGQGNLLLKMVRWIRSHCPPDTPKWARKTFCYFFEICFSNLGTGDMTGGM